jgi:hypothetical protein
MEVCDVLMLTVAESGVCVTREYVLGQHYTMERYLDMPVVPKEEKIISQGRSREALARKNHHGFYI